jgi:hypothetical protein
VDTVEDGARAAILEEAISAAVFERAKKCKNFDGMEKLDFELLDLIKGLTSGIEVKGVHHTEWESAILDGYKHFRKLLENKGGIICVSTQEPKLSYRPLSSDKQLKKIQNFFSRRVVKKTVKNISRDVGKKKKTRARLARKKSKAS